VIWYKKDGALMLSSERRYEHDARHIKVKVKVTLEQATKAQGGVEVKLYSSFNLNAR
jgi:hypothetical protein